MKKFGKFIFGALSIAALAGGAFYYLKNFVNKDSSDDFDDFDDDFEDFESDEEDDATEDTTADTREYVTLNMPEEDEALEESSDNTDTVLETPSEETTADAESEFDIEYHDEAEEQ
jgi:hypothetical protein